MGDENGNVLYFLFLGVEDQHGVSRRRRFKTYGKENDPLLRIGAGNLQAIERRVDHADVGALRFQHEQIAIRPGHAQHVAKRAEDYFGASGDRVGLVNCSQRSNTYGTTGAVDQFDALRQQPIDAVFHDRMGLTATNLHNYPGPSLDPTYLVQNRLRQASVAVLIDVPHCGFLADTSSTTGAWSSVS